MSRSRTREILLAVAFLAPSLVIFGLFVFYPMARTISLGRYKGGSFGGEQRVYVGWDQYVEVFRSNEFQHSLWVTILFALITVPIGLGLGVGLAVLADRQIRGIGFFRTAFSSTIATSVAVASLMWLALFQPSVGVFANIEIFGWSPAETFPVLKNPGLLNDAATALPSVAATSIWANLGFTFIVVTAALQSVPLELYESAELDGAGAWGRFTNVTLPMLSPTLLFVAVVATARAFQTYGEIDLLTGGGPGDETTNIPYLLYGQSSVINANDGLQAAVAVLLFVILLVLSVFQFRGIEKRVQYAR